jgi:hypothetical protein
MMMPKVVSADRVFVARILLNANFAATKIIFLPQNDRQKLPFRHAT